MTVETVHRWIHQRLLPGAYGGAPGHPWRIPVDTLDDFVQPMPGRPNARYVNAPKCVACEIILDEEWCTWNSDNLCDVCQETLQLICRQTGQEPAPALAQWMGEEVGV